MKSMFMTNGRTVNFQPNTKIAGGSIKHNFHTAIEQPMRASVTDMSAPIRLIAPKTNRRPLTLKL